jgi:hypothetical protein
MLVLGENDPDTLVTVSNMARALNELETCVEALVIYEKIVPKLRRVLGEGHTQTFNAMVGMADTLSNLKRRGEALKIFEEVSEKQSKLLGEEHLDTLESINSVSGQQYYLRRYEDAHRTASRGLLLARKIGNTELTDKFVHILSCVEASIDGGKDHSALTVEQQRVREKIRIRKRQDIDKRESELDAAQLLKSQPPKKEESIDDLMAKFGFDDEEDGDTKKKAGGGNAGQGGGGSKKKAKKGKGKK